MFGVLFERKFEIHWTIGPQSAEGMAALRSFAHGLKLKLTHIVLSHGDHPSQPMFTRRETAPYRTVLQSAIRVAEQLVESGFEVARTKIEQDLSDPTTVVEQLPFVAGGSKAYFEQHVKICLRRSDEISQLRALGAARNAHLSRNALRVDDQGRDERFLTQRVYSPEMDAAMTAFDSLYDSVHAEGIQIVSDEREYVVYDSRPTIDSGWMNQARESDRQ